MVVDPAVLLALGGALVSGGAAWGGARAALNGTRRRVEEIRNELVKHVEADAEIQRDVLDRLIRIETKLER